MQFTSQIGRRPCNLLRKLEGDLAIYFANCKVDFTFAKRFTTINKSGGELKYMKNPMMIVIIILVVAVVSFGVFTLSQKSSQSDSMIKNDEVMMTKDETSMKPNDTMIKDEDAMQNDKMMVDEQNSPTMKMSSSRYVEYSKGALESKTTDRRVLFFYASWCPTCKPSDVSFRENASKIPEDVTLIRVNYNDPETDQEEKDLAKKYGITYQHTFVQIDASGKEVTKWNGGQIDKLLSSVK